MSDPNAQATVARGHNLVVFAPPAPAGTGFILAGAFDRLTQMAGREARQVFLAVAPGEAISEWARVAERNRAGRPIRIAGAETPARLTRLLRESAIEFALTSPQIALELVRRAVLKLDQLSGILVIWPENWGIRGGDSLAALFQDIPKETQRIIVTTTPQGMTDVGERYCWRAPVSDQLGVGQAPNPPGVRTTPVSWERRVAILTDVVEALDPDSLAVWTADPSDHGPIVQALAAIGSAAVVTSQVPPPVSLVIAYDLPTPGFLGELAGSGEVLLLVPPGAEDYVSRLAPQRRPVTPRGILDRVHAEHDSAQREILQVLERGPRADSVLALAPLFQQFEPTAVAAAAFELWQESPRGDPPAALTPTGPARVKLWVGAGKRDAVTPHDLVATLTRECAVAKDAIGRIEIRETFSLIEIAESANPEAIADRLTGKTVRKRRLVARLDRKTGER